MRTRPAEPYRDRASAGRELAALVARERLRDPVVFALPRGGVPVGREIADRLRAPLEVLFVRKIGAPGQPELGLGAVGEGGVTVVDRDLVWRLGISDRELDAAVERARRELAVRVASTPLPRERTDPAGRDALLVDDGIATGGTALAGVDVLRHLGAARVIVAVPVAAAEGVARLDEVADLVLCPTPVRGGFAVGAWYDDFHQLDDAEVARLLSGAGGGTPAGEPAG